MQSEQVKEMNLVYLKKKNINWEVANVKKVLILAAKLNAENIQVDFKNHKCVLIDSRWIFRSYILLIIFKI